MTFIAVCFYDIFSIKTNAMNTRFLQLQFLLAISFYGVCHSSNILAFIPAPFRSQALGFQPLLLSLAERGHNVTVVTAFPEPKVPNNYHQIVVENILKKFDSKSLKLNNAFKFITQPIAMWNLFLPATEKILQDQNIQALIHSNDYVFDLVLVETFYHEAMIAIGHKFSAPTIILSAILLPTSNKWTGNAYNPSYITDVRLGFAGPLSFTQRVKNTITCFIQTWVEDFIYLPKQEALMNKYFNYTGSETRPSLSELMRNVSLTLIHSDYILFQPYPKVPSSIEMSGMHIRNEQLPQDLQEIMDASSPHGVIYFSFGSLINFEFLPKERISVLFQVLAEVPQTVLFKSELNDSTLQVPKNVIIRKWLPQTAILGHPNCKLFITHGGLHSMIETVHFGIPILGLPFFCDQRTNMKHASRKGYGVWTNFDQFTVDSLLNNINKMINDRKYTDAAKKMSELYHDKPMPPLNHTIYWIEYVIRHKGAPHLRPASHDLYWFQWCLLDVIVFVLIVIIVFLICIYKFFALIMFPFRRKLKQL